MSAVAYPSRVHPLRKVFRVAFAEPATPEELNLQQRLNEAHTYFFRRIYIKAMESYKSIWWWIHTMARPDLPELNYGASFGLDITPRPEHFEKLLSHLKDLLDSTNPQVDIPFGRIRPGGPQPDPVPEIRLGISSDEVLASQLEAQQHRLRPHLANPETCQNATRGSIKLARHASHAANEQLAADTYIELGAALAAADQRLPNPTASMNLPRKSAGKSGGGRPISREAI